MLAIVKKSETKKATKPVKARRGAKKDMPSKPKKKKAVAVTKLKTSPIKIVKPYTKSQLLSILAESTNLKKADMANVLEQLNIIIEAHLKKSGPGKFVLPGMLKMGVKEVAAKKARKGINPLTGQMTTFKAKPASRKVKITSLKALKEMVL